MRVLLRAAAAPLAQAEDDKLGWLDWRDADVDEELAPVAYIGRIDFLVAFDEEGFFW
jgi:hypothetical protein